MADTLENMTDVKVTYRNDGTEIYEKLTKLEASEEKYSFIHLTIIADHAEAVIVEIGKIIENQGFEFSAPIISCKITNIKYSLLGDYFFSEIFFGTLKVECLHRMKFADRDDVQSAVDEYVHFYNFERIDLKNGSTPFEIRSKAV